MTHATGGHILLEFVEVDLPPLPKGNMEQFIVFTEAVQWLILGLIQLLFFNLRFHLNMKLYDMLSCFGNAKQSRNAGSSLNSKDCFGQYGGY
jgi:hypothetical protein